MMVRRVTDTASSAAGRLPAPLGPAAAQTVETIESTAGGLVPPGPSAPAQAASQAGMQLTGKVAALASGR
jgi:hypothetical protein